MRPAGRILFLFFIKSRTCGLSTAACPASFDIHMIRRTFAVIVVDAFFRFAVNGNGLACIFNRIGIAVASFSSLCKAFAAGLVLAAGFLSAYRNIALATISFSVLRTIFH